MDQTVEEKTAAEKTAAEKTAAEKTVLCPVCRAEHPLGALRGVSGGRWSLGGLQGGHFRIGKRKMPKARGEIVRLSFDVSPELNETLETLAQKIHGSKSDVLRKAIVLMEVAVKAKEDKKKFGVAAPEQTLETEIVGL
jgi:hypothetical protein